MQFAAHLPLQGGIDQLVLAYARKAGKGAGGDLGAVMVAVAGQILDDDLGVRESLAQPGSSMAHSPSAGFGATGGGGGAMTTAAVVA